jgi:hypothetical protein
MKYWILFFSHFTAGALPLVYRELHGLLVLKEVSKSLDHLDGYTNIDNGSEGSCSNMLANACSGERER